MDTDKTTPRVWISTADFAELVDIHEVTIRRLRTLDGGPFQQGRDFRRIGAKGFRIQWHADNAQQSLTDWKGVVRPRRKPSPGPSHWWIADWGQPCSTTPILDAFCRAANGARAPCAREPTTRTAG